jgi:putative toxin-antitoxin system antitoxin component (TIGR02293 family)
MFFKGHALPPRNLIALILGITVVPLFTLLWLGWRLLEQDRVLEGQQAQQRMERAADLVVAAFERALSSSQQRLAAGQAIVIFTGAAGDATLGAIIYDRMVNELQAIVDELGGEPALGRSLRTQTDLLAAIREGFSQNVLEEVMQAAGLTLAELAVSLDLSPRSLQRRRHTGRLAPQESDRLYRLARTVALAKHYLGDSEKATRWLKRPNRALGDVSPLDLIDTEAGARAVENVLGRIAYGGVS